MKKKYGLSVRLSERTKNMSETDKKFIGNERLEILKYCKKKGLLLLSLDKIKETSVVNQIKDGFKYCEDNDLILEKVYIDIYISGAKKWERKELMEMFDDFDKGKIQGFIFKDSKRFARDMILQENLLNEYKDQKGAEFRFMQGQERMSNEFDRKLDGLLNERIIIQGKINAKRLMKRKIEERLPCIPAPFGYKYNEKKNWDIIEKDAIIIRSVAQDVAKNKDYKEICKKLKIKKNFYYRIKKNIEKGIYHGKINFKKNYKNLEGKVYKTEIISYEGTYEPIL